MEALRLTNVDFGYPGRPGVLRRAHLRVHAGEVVVVEGPSGSGKSSLLAIAAGLQEPLAGSVHVMGQEMPHPDQAAPLRAQHIGLVFQHLNLLEEMNVEENVALPLRLRRAPRARREARTQTLLERFGLAELATRMPDTLSGGEQQRVAICRALAPEPGLLLVDEPTSNLDSDNTRMVIDALDEAAAMGAGVLVATHDEALRHRDPLYRIQDGRVLRRKRGDGAEP